MISCLDIFDDGNCIAQFGSDRYFVMNHFQKKRFPSLSFLDSSISSSMVVVTISILVPVLGIEGGWLWFGAKVVESGVVGIGEKARVL